MLPAAYPVTIHSVAGAELVHLAVSARLVLDFLGELVWLPTGGSGSSSLLAPMVLFHWQVLWALARRGRWHLTSSRKGRRKPSSSSSAHPIRLRSRCTRRRPADVAGRELDCCDRVIRVIDSVWRKLSELLWPSRRPLCDSAATSPVAESCPHGLGDGEPVGASAWDNGVELLLGQAEADRNRRSRASGRSSFRLGWRVASHVGQRAAGRACSDSGIMVRSRGMSIGVRGRRIRVTGRSRPKSADSPERMTRRRLPAWASRIARSATSIASAPSIPSRSTVPSWIRSSARRACSRAGFDTLSHRRVVSIASVVRWVLARAVPPEMRATLEVPLRNALSSRATSVCPSLMAMWLFAYFTRLFPTRSGTRGGGVLRVWSDGYVRHPDGVGVSTPMRDAEATWLLRKSCDVAVHNALCNTKLMHFRITTWPTAWHYDQSPSVWFRPDWLSRTFVPRACWAAEAPAGAPPTPIE